MPPLLRLAHLADTHIGMENYGRLDPETGLNQRLHDFLRSLDSALDAALAADVDLVVLAGDVYKTRDPTPTHQREFARRVRRLVDRGIPLVLIAGNHDIPLAQGRATSVEVFHALEMQGVTVARSIGVHRVQTRRGPVQVLALPWLVRSLMLAQAEFKNHTLEELNAAMLDLARAKLRTEAERLDPRLPAVVVGHAHVLGARVGSERLLTMGSDPMFDLQTFDLPNVDYVALGHIHKHQALSYSRPAVVYAGSIERVDFGEEQEEKGWIYAEVTEKGETEWEFRPVPARRFVTVEARVDGEDGLAMEEVTRAIARAGDSIRDAVVRLRIDIPPERLGELRDSEIRAQLRDAFYLAPIERQVRRAARERGGANVASLPVGDPIAVLEHYLERQRVEKAQQEVLLRYARGLMQRGGEGAAAP